MLKVMIAEDDLMMADMLEDVLVGNGYEVCGIARTVEMGVELAERHKPDLAVLDLRLAEGGIATEIAARLNRPDGLGILYATGNGTQISLTKADGDAWLGKPYRPEDIVRALKIVEQIASTGEASKPRYRMSGWKGSSRSSLTLILLRLEFRAPVRLAGPSRLRSAADRTCTFPGILSMSMMVPGIAVAVTTMACSFSKLLGFAACVEVSAALPAFAAMLTEITIAQHGRIATNSRRVTGKLPTRKR